MNLVIIFFPLMLKKPSARSKPRDHTKYLQKRLQMWKDGNLSGLLREAREIQTRMVKSKQKKKESIKQTRFYTTNAGGEN